MRADLTAEAIEREFQRAEDELAEARDEVDRLLARVIELESGEMRTDWGVRWPGDPDIEFQPDHDDPTGEKHARRVNEMYSSAELWTREVRLGPWKDAS